MVDTRNATSRRQAVAEDSQQPKEPQAPKMDTLTSPKPKTISKMKAPRSMPKKASASERATRVPQSPASSKGNHSPNPNGPYVATMHIRVRVRVSSRFRFTSKDVGSKPLPKRVKKVSDSGRVYFAAEMPKTNDNTARVKPSAQGKPSFHNFISYDSSHFCLCRSTTASKAGTKSYRRGQKESKQGQGENKQAGAVYLYGADAADV